MYVCSMCAVIWCWVPRWAGSGPCGWGPSRCAAQRLAASAPSVCVLLYSVGSLAEPGQVHVAGGPRGAPL